MSNANTNTISHMGPETASASVQMPGCDKTLTTEVNGDFSLPDYQPEIKRLLRIDTTCLPPTRYNGGGSIDLGGSVDYFVLYMGNDDQLYCAPLSSDYRMTVPVDGDGEGTSQLGEPLVCLCDLVAESATGRVTAPRRLNIKCRLKAHVKTFGEKDLTCPEENGLMPGSVERLEGRCEVGRFMQGSGDLLELQDDMILSPVGGTSGELRVVCAEGHVMVTEATASADMVNCRGEVTVKLTLCPVETEEDRLPDAMPPLPYLTLRKISFSQSIDMPGITPSYQACAFGVCSALSVQVEEGHLHMDIGVLLEALAQHNEEAVYTKDLYSTRTASECRYATHTTGLALHCLNGNFTLSDSKALSEVGIDPGAQILDAVASAVPEALVCEKGRYLLTGSCRCQLLLYRQGEYSSAEMTLPFRYETDLPARAGEEEGSNVSLPAFDGQVTAVTCRARMDGERVGVDAELAICLRLSDVRPLKTLAGMSFGPELVHTRGEYVICFPSPTDTLWSVAKRYHAPMTALAAANALPPASAPDSPDALSGVSYLIV